MKDLMGKLFLLRLPIIGFLLLLVLLGILYLTAPSALHLICKFPSKGDLVKGETSGAIGSILQVSIEDITGDDEAGSFSNSDAEGYVYFTVVTGTLEDGETMFFLNKDSAFGSAFNVEYG